MSENNVASSSGVIASDGVEPCVIGAVHLADDAVTGTARVEQTIQLLEAAAFRNCRLVVIPELAFSNLAGIALHGVDRSDEVMYTEALHKLQSFARRRQCAVVTPMLLPAAEGGYHNGAIVINELGAVAGMGAKNCLPGGLVLDESSVFVAGRGFCVATVAGMRVGVLICYDRRKLANWLALAAGGVRVVAVLVAGPSDDPPGAALKQLRVFSRLSRMTAVVASRAGFDVEDGLVLAHEACTCIVLPTGAVACNQSRANVSTLCISQLDQRVVGSAFDDGLEHRVRTVY
jgi:predicted amidohydrolase